MQTFKEWLISKKSFESDLTEVKWRNLALGGLAAGSMFMGNQLNSPEQSPSKAPVMQASEISKLSNPQERIQRRQDLVNSFKAPSFVSVGLEMLKKFPNADIEQKMEWAEEARSEFAKQGKKLPLFDFEKSPEGFSYALKKDKELPSRENELNKLLNK